MFFSSDVKNVLGKMGIKLTEKEQLMLSKTLPVSSEYLIYHHGAQEDELLTSG